MKAVGRILTTDLEEQMKSSVVIQTFDDSKTFQSPSIACDTDTKTGQRRMVATADIKAGTVIASAAPISTIRRLKDNVTDSQLFTFWSYSLMNDLGAQLRDAVERLQPKDVETTWWNQLMFLYPRCPSSNDETQYQRFYADKLFRNAFRVDTGFQVFGPLISGFNHSCEANCYIWSTKEFMHEIRTYQDVGKGQELTVMYSAPMGKAHDAKKRQRHLQLKNGFDCTCAACVDNRSTVPYWIKTMTNVISADRLFCACCHLKTVTPKWCSRCGIAMYCSKECQSVHWKLHHKALCV
jgi:hypothetical protein